MEMEKSAFARLPEDIILQCPSYAAAHNKIPVVEDQDNLLRLRGLFAQEIKRNLFEALRPKETIINIVSSSISSSSAPGGEACHFSISPSGVLVLAYNSSRIHIIDVEAPEVQIIRELKILRRPAAVAITDNGSTLAVLSTDLQVDLYNLDVRPPKHIRAVTLDQTPRTIALSPSGQVLAAAYDSGVELTSLLEAGTSRAVKAYGVDSLTFSCDSDLLLGTTLQSRNPSTVVLTAPYYDPGSVSPEESVSALWTTSILFPNGSRDCSHAVLLPSPHDGEASWTFTYDRIFETFRCVRIDDLRNGKVHFVGPNGEPPATKAAASRSGDLVAVAYMTGGIWMWGIPEDLDAIPNAANGSNSNGETEPGTPLSQVGRRNSAPSLRSVNRSIDRSNLRIPQWQLLCDKSRNTFVEGRQITSLDGVSSLNWVQAKTSQPYGERLVAVAPGVRPLAFTGDSDSMNPVDGGRICILDFSSGPTCGEKTITTIEVGVSDPEMLEEEQRDLDTEVAIVRRRTVAQRRSARASLARATTTVIRPEPPPVPDLPSLSDPSRISLPATPRRVSRPEASPQQSEIPSIGEDQDHFDDPYSHTAPRSGTTLRRAATAAALNRRLHPRSVVQDLIEYRRADGREEHPHESDADNWEPPPPPYQKEPVPALPEHIQRSILADHARMLQRANTQRAPVLDFPGIDAPILPRPLPETLRRPRYSNSRPLSDVTPAAFETSPIADEAPRPVTSPSDFEVDSQNSPRTFDRSADPDFDSLYDVSPVGTPQPGPPQREEQQIRRRPVGGNIDTTSAADLPNSSATGTMLQYPVSPAPQSMNETLDQRLLDWESTTVDAQDSAAQSSPPPPAIAQEYSNAPERQPPPIPLSGPSDINPVQQRSTFPRVKDTTSNSMFDRESNEESIPIWRRVNTAPAAPDSGNETPRVLLPSADLLARFNSRSGRPAGLTDPSRRRSGSLPLDAVPLQGDNNNNENNQAIACSAQTTSRPTLQPSFLSSPPNFTSSSHSAHIPHKSLPSRSNIIPQSPYNHLSPSRRQSVGSQRHPGSPSTLRPPFQRLETIHSAASNGGISPFGMPVPTRQSSKARNVKQMRRKTWRQSIKAKKSKDKSDGASSFGWTDSSWNSRPATSPAAFDTVAPQNKKSSMKCTIM